MVDVALVKKIEGAPFQYGDRVKVHRKRRIGTVVSLQWDAGSSKPDDPHIMVSFGADVALYWKEELEAVNG